VTVLAKVFTIPLQKPLLQPSEYFCLTLYINILKTEIMKKLLFLRKTILVGILLFGLSSIGQTLVKPSQASLSYLKNLFENAKVKVEETAPDHIKIRQIYLLRVDVDYDKQFITFKTNYALKDKVTEQQALALANRLNIEIPLAKISYDKTTHSMRYEYQYWIKDGFTVQGLVSASDFFSRLITLSFDKDKDGWIDS